MSQEGFPESLGGTITINNFGNIAFATDGIRYLSNTMASSNTTTIINNFGVIEFGTNGIDQLSTSVLPNTDSTDENRPRIQGIEVSGIYSCRMSLHERTFWCYKRAFSS